jgi:hypothetical protein
LNYILQFNFRILEGFLAHCDTEHGIVVLGLNIRHLETLFGDRNNTIAQKDDDLEETPGAGEGDQKTLK